MSDEALNSRLTKRFEVFAHRFWQYHHQQRGSVAATQTTGKYSGGPSSSFENPRRVFSVKRPTRTWGHGLVGVGPIFSAPARVAEGAVGSPIRTDIEEKPKAMPLMNSEPEIFSAAADSFAGDLAGDAGGHVTAEAAKAADAG